MLKLLAILLLLLGIAVICWQTGWLQAWFVEDSVPVVIDNGKFEGVWCNKDQCFWFDEKGISNKTAPRPEGNLIILVNDPVGDVKPSTLPLTESFWSNMAIVLQSWPIKDWIINQLVIDRKTREVTASSDQLDIRFGLQFDPTTNLKALKKMVDKNKINVSELTYIDLRVENKIYFR